jgi:hypothetical protein
VDARAAPLGAFLLSGACKLHHLCAWMCCWAGRSACAVDGNIGKAVLQSVLVGLEVGPQQQSRRAELDKPGAGSGAKVVRVRCSWDSAPAPLVVVASPVEAAEAGAALAELRTPPGADPPRCEVSVAFAAEARVDRLACVASAKLAEVLFWFDGSYVT